MFISKIFKIQAIFLTAISFLFISQRAVKAWMIEHSLEKMVFGQVNTNFIDFIVFIDFLQEIFDMHLPSLVPGSKTVIFHLLDLCLT